MLVMLMMMSIGNPQQHRHELLYWVTSSSISRLKILVLFILNRNQFDNSKQNLGIVRNYTQHFPSTPPGGFSSSCRSLSAL